MKFSICIPNYNYAHYLDKTLESVFNLTNKDFELVVADNASTDESVPLLNKFASRFSNIKFVVNRENVGFSANLDRAASLANGEYMIMLSSDDLINPQALATYETVLEGNRNIIVSSSTDIITSQGARSGYSGPNNEFWKKKDIDQALSERLGCPVYRVKADVLMRRCLLRMGSPFNFCTVAYPRTSYDAVGGYGATRLINPDKWYHWKLLTVVEEAVFIDKPLFQYRWHNQNQTAQQLNSGHLKYLVDEYRSTIEITPAMLKVSGLQLSDIYKAFVKHDIARHSLGEFSKNRWLKSLRVLFWGMATYPGYVLKNPLSWLAMLAVLSGPPGAFVISKLKR